MLSITIFGLVFFLLVVCTGYFTLKGSKTIRKKSGLESQIYYLLTGIGINAVFLFIFSRVEDWRKLLDAFLVASRNNTITGNDIISITLFVLGYFVTLIVFILLVKGVLRGIRKNF